MKKQQHGTKTPHRATPAAKELVELREELRTKEASVLALEQELKSVHGSLRTMSVDLTNAKEDCMAYEEETERVRSVASV